MGSFVLAITNALTLFKTLIFLCVARVVTLVFHRPQKFDVLVGSNYGDFYDPNATALSTYLSSEDVVTAKIVNRVIASEENLIPRGSFMASCHFLRASVVCYTHSLSDILPHAHRLYMFKSVLCFPKTIFLQHGVIGLKNRLSNGVSMPEYISILEKTFDYMVVSSDWEKQIVLKMGVSEEKLSITGLPRFDRYMTHLKVAKTVLIFFTWQDPHNYKKKVDEVLHSRAIASLKSNGYEIKVANHNMQLDSESNKLESRKSNDLDALILESAILITDDSSVAWDFLYTSRDVIFYKPSTHWLIDFDFLDEHICINSDDLEDAVASVLKGNWIVNPNQVFSYVDAANSDRVATLVKEILSLNNE